MNDSKMNDRLATLAWALANSFETATRTDGGDFVRLRDGSADWKRDLCRAAHGPDMLPDDWRYKMISRAADWLADADPDAWDDSISEAADSLVSVYTADLMSWVSSRLDRGSYCEEAARELGATAEDFVGLLRAGQYMEYSEVLAALVSGLQARAESELEDEETAEEGGEQ